MILSQGWGCLVFLVSTMVRTRLPLTGARWLLVSRTRSLAPNRVRSPASLPRFATALHPLASPPRFTPSPRPSLHLRARLPQAFLVSLAPTSWAIDRFGPRKVTVLSAVLICLCAGVRCIPVAHSPTRQAIMYGSMVLNGMSGCWLNFGGYVVIPHPTPPSHIQHNTTFPPCACTASSSDTRSVFVGKGLE